MRFPFSISQPVSALDQYHPLALGLILESRADTCDIEKGIKIH